jgi:hypothetical protein
MTARNSTMTAAWAATVASRSALGAAHTLQQVECLTRLSMGHATATPRILRQSTRRSATRQPP